MSGESPRYVLLPGAGGDSWYWQRVAARLRERGHEVVTPDLPCGDDAAGLADYADVVAGAIGDRAGVILATRRPCGSWMMPSCCHSSRTG
jgi:pimeloyl-ACP methyl ester carboxylesterase